MPTNDEIKYKGGVELANNKSLESVIDKMLKEARADTAKQIFAELEKHNTGYGDIILSKEELLELKKKYKAD